MIRWFRRLVTTEPDADELKVAAALQKLDEATARQRRINGNATAADVEAAADDAIAVLSKALEEGDG